jgi:hypothetical protein
LGFPLGAFKFLIKSREKAGILAGFYMLKYLIVEMLVDSSGGELCIVV